MIEGLLQSTRYGVVRWGLQLPFNGLVEVAGTHDCTELRAQVADQEMQGSTDGPPLGALVVDVDVGDREIRARRVGALRNLPMTTTPSTAHEA